MPLLDVRRNFITYSGRYDLVLRPSFADNGADFYIRAGQQYLDINSSILKSESKYYGPLVVNSWYLLAPDCRVVEQVYLANSTGTKTELLALPMEEFRDRFYYNPSSSHSGSYCSKYYSVSNLRTTPQKQGEITIENFGPFTNTILGDEYSNLGVLIGPAISIESTLEIVGKFYQPKLVLDSDTNFWTEVYPQILVMSACRQLEISYRNTVGVKDWESSIKAELLGLELDYADQESVGIRKFRG